MWISSLKRRKKIQADLSFLSVIQGCWLRDTPRSHGKLQPPACVIQSRGPGLISAVLLQSTLTDEITGLLWTYTIPGEHVPRNNSEAVGGLWLQ